MNFGLVKTFPRFKCERSEHPRGEAAQIKSAEGA